MVELATRFGQGPVMMKAVAANQSISRKYLHSLLTSLKAAGLVRSVRGAAGGYMLARPPDQIHVNEVVQALEGSLAPVDCVTDPSCCKRIDQCVARDVWTKLHDAINDVLKGVRLDELVARQNAMQTQLMMYYI